MQKIILLFFSLVIFTACSKIPSPETRYKTADKIAKIASLKKQIYKTKNFSLLTYSTDLKICKDSSIRTYIEGDGLAWISSSTISNNPTPINPMSLKLMLQDPSKCKLYIARPCQYVNSSKCEKKYWTSHRFSNEVIMSTDKVMDNIKSIYKNKSFTIYGYSGGGAVATLVSTRRDDIDKLVTIAGNLDTEFWVKKHYLTPLYGSLNPADYSNELSKIKQIHLIGEKDNIVDISIFKSYESKYKNKKDIHFKIYKGFTHNKGWDDNWQHILKNIE